MEQTSKPIQEMTSKELETLKREFYVAATNDGRIDNLYLIARYLGERVSHNYGPKYRYIQGELEIYVDDYGNYMTAKLNSKLIVSTHNERLYVPGEWETHIPQLVYLAEAAKKDLASNREAEEKNELLTQLTIPNDGDNLHPLFKAILKPYMP